MMARRLRTGGVTCGLALGLVLPLATGYAQPANRAPENNVASASHDLAEARSESVTAGVRAQRLDSAAASASVAADRTADEVAAAAARIQQTQAEMTADSTTIALLDRQRAALRARIAAQQQPLLRLTAALQLLARRPLTLAILRPGSLSDTMHLQALLETMIPEVRRRTATLRAELLREKTLQNQALLAQSALSKQQNQLVKRRQTLALLEARQRVIARHVLTDADQETERSLALAEQAHDLTALVTVLGKEQSLAVTLEQLPGPVLPPSLRQGAAPQAISTGDVAPEEHLAHYILPVAGRLVSGFGEAGPEGAMSQGISLAPQPGAQIVAPDSGRIAFAGPWSGYDQIVIIAHDDGWISLVTGLAVLDVRVGDRLVTGSPLGVAGAGRPIVTLELRHHGVSVDPLGEVHGF